MEQHTLFYNTNTTKPMSTCYYNPPSNFCQNQEIFFNESSQSRNQSRELEDVIEDEDESEFKMGRLIRQASLNSSQMAASPPQQITKVMKGSSSLPRYSSQKPEANNQEKMRKYESMKERSRSKNNMKMSGGPPTIPGGWADNKSSSEDIKEQIKFWARAVAFNVHQEC